MTDWGQLESLRSEQCVSDYKLDCLLAGALSESDAQALLRDVETCPVSTKRLEQLRAERAEFAKRPIPIELGRTRSSRGPRAAVAMLVAAAAAIFFIQRPAEDSGVIRTKGGPWFGYTVVAPDGTVRGDQDTALASPGDELQWTLRVDGPRYVAVLSRDSRGIASVYFPDGQTAARVEPRGGQTQTLPLATRLDAELGEEELYGLICEAPVSVVSLVTQLDAGDVRFPPDCLVVRWDLVKEARP